jgi:hypothetical protein
MSHRPVVIAYLEPQIRKGYTEVLRLEGFTVMSTDRADVVYEHLRMSQAPQIVLLGNYLVGSSRSDAVRGIDVLRAAAEDAALVRHEYIVICPFYRIWAPQVELDALSRSLCLKHLPFPFTTDQLLDMIDAPAPARGEDHQP